MKPTIHILPEHLCNKIAAGEVVERPSSVVKELVENSIDSGATVVTVELESGGKRLIRVADDGCGMNRQDAFLSFERHATSKIETDQDLFALTTLGFRGEALASIASVSRLKLSTCDNNDGCGHQIYAEGGKIKQAHEIGLPRGTVVEVRNLFFNLPARKKFLRKEQTEFGHAADIVTKQALARPHVSFVLRHNDRVLLDLRREKGLSERVAALLGRSLLKDMLPIDSGVPSGLKIHGLVSQPQLNRSAATHVYTFINGRYIRDRVVQHAVMEGYRHLLMKGRYPVAVLFLEIDPADVDVNVHPTKHEVRFQQQSLVHDFIAESIKAVLRPAAWVDHEPEPHEVAQRTMTSFDSTVLTGGEKFQSETSAIDHGPQQVFQPAAYVPEQSTDPQMPASEAVAEEASENQYLLMATDDGGFFSGLQILGQYHRSYILCQDGEDLVLVDQHAAHERVGFESLRRSYAKGRISSQALLFPEILDLDFNSANALADHLGELSALGFEVEPFGGKSFALKAIPQLLAGVAAVTLVMDVALELERIGRTGQLQDSIDEVLIMMACHSVVRANQSLSVAEIKALFMEMDKIDFKANCPHGRPVMQRLSLVEIERMFRRQ